LALLITGSYAMISLVRPASDEICLKWPWNWNEFDTPDFYRTTLQLDWFVGTCSARGQSFRRAFCTRY